jgi:ubiquinone/menaquinone biosynthesis C-methylase UbiE
VRTTPDPRWEAFARAEPYYAVLTHERFLRRNLTVDTEREWFESGELYVRHVLHELDAAPRSVLELGCGPGRLAIPFARHANVTAVDISPAMLAHARWNAERFGRTIHLRTLPEFLASTDTYELINAALVFQRIEPRDGLELLREVLERAAGAVFLQIPVAAHARKWRALPGINLATNIAKHRPWRTPPLTPHVYDLDAVLALIRDAGLGEPRVTIEQQGELRVATLHAARAFDGAAHGLIDVKQLIASKSVEELNALAETYFSSLTDWNAHLAKPFHLAEEAAAILPNVGAMLHGLKLYRGARVIELGAGTGWLARWLAQLGCEMTLLDVSPTALEIARELFARQPLIGDRPAPRFLVFDGHRIDLPDASVDRALTFDAFHHVPNPDEVLAEIARVLAPGGIAGFAEPGPAHSRSPMSQYEMRTFGVVENDVDVRAIWAAAQRAGFTSIRVAAFSPRPLLLSIDDYEGVIRGAGAFATFVAAARDFLRDARLFFLEKGEPVLDSRRTEGLACAIAATRDGNTVRVTITNSGRAMWLPSDAVPGGVQLGVHRYDGERLADLDYQRVALPRALQPGESAEVTLTLPPGSYELDCVANEVTWFAQIGSEPVRLRLDLHQR